MQKKILIVEDEILIAQQLRKIVTNHGYACVGMAISFDHAVEVLDNQEVDIVLLDINISGERTGLDLAQHINNEYQIPFLFLTSYTDQATLEAVKKCHPKGYLSKPVNKATLLTNLDIIMNEEKVNSKAFTLTLGNSSYSIDFSELLFVKSTHVYVEMHFISQKLVLRISLKELLTKIPKGQLIRINRSIAINPDRITKRVGAMVHLDDHSFKVSKNYTATL